ncbi:MAG: HD domain-containing protein, partial [Lentisphaeria bacterium]|nr:HD domain-containing protein [Lentisphaeria bacterium]
MPASGSPRLDRQLRFLLEIDRLKGVLRRSYVDGGRRRENAAEHSWHVAVMAFLLGEYADSPLDLGRVVRMLLVHDVVEVDAGDTYLYDDRSQATKAAREQRAAERLFGLLPEDLAADVRALWEEYECGVTSEARFARSMDRLLPLLHNVLTGGRSWREHGVCRSRVEAFLRPGIEPGSGRLWEYARILVDEAARQGHFAPEPDPGPSSLPAAPP